MKSPLLRFLVFILLLLLGLEVLVRANGKYFYALSDKLLLKAEILDREPETRVLFLGTSRFLDAVDHHLFTKELENRIGVKFISLNAATTGLQSERLEFFAKIAEKNEGLTHVIIEASPPAMKTGNLGLPTLPDETADKGPELEGLNFPDRIEKRLQHFVVNKVALVKYRKALRPKTLVKLSVLYTANVSDPNIWSRKGPVQAILFPKNEKVTDEEIKTLAPTKVGQNGGSAVVEGEAFENLYKVAKVFENSSKKVIWIAPPVSKPAVRGSHNDTLTNYYQSIANEFGHEFYDYAGIGFEDDFLRDPTHLNARGRSLFSKLLAAHLSSHFDKD